MPKTKDKKWEERFEEAVKSGKLRRVYAGEGIEPIMYEINIEKVKHFISNLLSKERKKAYEEGWGDAIRNSEGLASDEAWSLARQAFLEGFRGGRK